VKKSNIAIIVIVIVFICLIAVIAVINRNGIAQPSGDHSLIVRSGEQTLKEYTVSDLKALPSVEIYKSISSGKHEDEQGNFKGVPLETLLSDAAPDWQGRYKEFIFSGSDGFTSSVFASDIEKGENVLVVYAKDGGDLKGPEEGGKGPLRIIVVDDPFGNRSAYLLTSIEVK
jgi:hypothetical protein